MKSILFAIIIVISVNIQPAEAQSGEQEQENELVMLMAKLDALTAQAEALHSSGRLQDIMKRAQQSAEDELNKILQELKSKLQNLSERVHQSPEDKLDSHSLQKLTEEVNELNSRLKSIIEEINRLDSILPKLSEMEQTTEKRVQQSAEVQGVAFVDYKRVLNQVKISLQKAVAQARRSLVRLKEAGSICSSVAGFSENKVVEKALKELSSRN